MSRAVRPRYLLHSLHWLLTASSHSLGRTAFPYPVGSLCLLMRAEKFISLPADPLGARRNSNQPSLNLCGPVQVSAADSRLPDQGESMARHHASETAGLLVAISVTILLSACGDSPTSPGVTDRPAAPTYTLSGRGHRGDREGARPRHRRPRRRIHFSAGHDD